MLNWRGGGTDATPRLPCVAEVDWEEFVTTELQTGVYAIVYIGPVAEGKTAKRYVGSTTRTFDIRWEEHRYFLRRGTHTCRYLQTAWNKYGESFFEFRVTDRLAPEDVVQREQEYLDVEAVLRKSNNGCGDCYNRSMNAAGGGGDPTPETRAKMAASQRKRDPSTQPRGDRHGSKTHPERVVRGDDQWMRKHPERVRRGSDACPFPERLVRGDNHWARKNPEKVSGEHNAAAKVTTADVMMIRHRYADGETQAQLAIAFGVRQTAISRIVRGKRWAHVADGVTTQRNMARGDKSGARLHPERVARGEKVTNAKLTECAVREIRSRSAAGETRIALGVAFNITRSTIGRILRRQTWNHVQDQDTP